MSETTMTPDEIARTLGVHVLTVYDWIKKGGLVAAKRYTGHFIVQEKDLEAFLSAREAAKMMRARAVEHLTEEVGNRA